MGSSRRLRHLLGYLCDEAGEVHIIVSLLPVLVITARQTRPDLVLVLPDGSPVPLDTQAV